jgi:hypothetical protein
MAYYRPNEVAEVLNLNRTNVYTFQKRRQLVLTDTLPVSGMIDENNPVNEHFIARRLGIKTPKLEQYLKDNPAEKVRKTLYFDPEHPINIMFLNKRGFTVESFKKKVQDLYTEKLRVKMEKYFH